LCPMSMKTLLNTSLMADEAPGLATQKAYRAPKEHKAP
jgi:hypothetical protein